MDQLSLLEFRILEQPDLGTAAGMIHSESVHGQGNLLDGDPSENFAGSLFLWTLFCMQGLLGNGWVVGGGRARPGKGTVHTWGGTGGGYLVPEGWSWGGALCLRSGDKISCHSLVGSLLGLGVIVPVFFLSALEDSRLWYKPDS